MTGTNVLLLLDVVVDYLKEEVTFADNSFNNHFE